MGRRDAGACDRGTGVPLSELFERRRSADDPALLRAQSRVLRYVQDESIPDRHHGAAAFTLLNLIHDDELVRVAAAASATTTFERTQQAADFLIPILAEGCQSQVETVRQLAANALERLDPRHPALEELSGEDEEKGMAVMANTSTTVHGTWARLRSRWWKPGGDLHSYLLSKVSQDLYAGDDHFRWDGRYKGGAREKEAIDLQTWTAGKNVPRLDIVYAHSHGGNVAFDAAELGVGMCLLVLMSVPARKRKPDEWKTIWTNVSRAVSIRPKLDLVVLAPRRWFGHGVVLQPQTWDDNDLPNEVKYERSLACK
jgi:hypothetical protein